MTAVRATLDRAWIYAGRIYGPGPVELPADVAAALQARSAFSVRKEVVAEMTDATTAPPKPKRSRRKKVAANARPDQL